MALEISIIFSIIFIPDMTNLIKNINFSPLIRAIFQIFIAQVNYRKTAQNL
jgi:hypothetical protein